MCHRFWLCLLEWLHDDDLLCTLAVIATGVDEARVLSIFARYAYRGSLARRGVCPLGAAAISVLCLVS